jgi:putative phosphoesterase
VQTAVGVISDTHGLLRESAARQLSGVDLIIHAGDAGNASVLESLNRIAPVHAVRGNVDIGSWADSLPLTLIVNVRDVRILVVHNLDALKSDPAKKGFAAVVSGHSHKPSRELRDGVLYLNPGSAGPRRFRLPITLARMIVDGDSVQADIITLEA